MHGGVQAQDAGLRTDPEAKLLANTGSTGAPVTIRLAPQVRPEPGSTIHLSVALAAIHVFGAATGDALR